ncbi:MAG: BON domain-containing protein [Pirellulales bacterium]|nr:BON domain-containing protein [Pirellulales bacterium]
MRRFWLGLAISGCAALLPTVGRADDQDLAQQIAENFKNSGQLKGYSINVVVEGGIVELNGRVSNADQLDRAIALAEVTPGIERVVNNLEIKAPAPRGAANGLRQPNNLFANQPTPAPAEVQRVSAAMPTQPTYAPQATSQRPMPMQQRQMAQSRPQQYPMAQQYAPAPQYAAQPRPAQYAQPLPQSAGRPVGTASGTSGKITYANTGSTPRKVNTQGARPLGYPQLASRQVPAAGDSYAVPGELGVQGAPLPAHIPSPASCPPPAMYDSPNMPNYAWPSYAAYPNYAAVNYPKQYSATAWPYIGPFYPYPQVPLGWRKVSLEWDDGWWFLDFKD